MGTLKSFQIVFGLVSFHVTFNVLDTKQKEQNPNKYDVIESIGFTRTKCKLQNDSLTCMVGKIKY